MDVAGPKLRTGPIEGGPAVSKYRPKRDSYGRVESPARIWLTAESNPAAPPSVATAAIPVPGDWLSRVQPGTRIRFTDTRGARRFMTVTTVSGEGRWAEASRTAYLAPDVVLEAVAAEVHADEMESVRVLARRPDPVRRCKRCG